MSHSSRFSCSFIPQRQIIPLFLKGLEPARDIYGKVRVCIIFMHLATLWLYSTLQYKPTHVSPATAAAFPSFWWRRRGVRASGAKSLKSSMDWKAALCVKLPSVNVNRQALVTPLPTCWLLAILACERNSLCLT